MHLKNSYYLFYLVTTIYTDLKFRKGKGTRSLLYIVLLT